MIKSYLRYFVIAACLGPVYVWACASRTSIPKPQQMTTIAPISTTPRPNITFPILNCPPPYAAWYCLNDATCFKVEIHNEVLYNCECANGFMGPRCEYKEVDGSYLPTRQRAMLETASIASGATLALIFMLILCFSLYIRHDKQQKTNTSETPVMTHDNGGMDEVDGITKIPELRPFGPHHYQLSSSTSSKTTMSDNNQGIPQELGPPKEDFSAPPPYELTNSHLASPALGQQQQSTQLPLNQEDLLTQQLQPQQHEIPTIIHHGKLPTYEEVQMEKSLNGELPPGFLTTTLHPPPPPPNPLLANLRDTQQQHRLPGSTGASPALTFIAIDASEAENLTNTTDNNLLGTDIMFITAFMVSFLFNWIGFLMLTCFCHTIAARYGALSGFGLSLAKWTLIVKHSTDLASHENSWLWWLIMTFGFLICVRALIQYISIKRTWRLLSSSAQERLLFFY